MKKAPCIAILGTGSEVGKSIVATALCRLFVNKGLRVAPFKAQNMSNNSGVTPEGLEMGRAQIVQAEAAKIPPHVDMNPILLKPTGEIGAQVVLFGEAIAEKTAREYHRKKDMFFSKACHALDRLRLAHDLIVMEGAGSCAEVNLMDSDIVNLRMAEYADAPVILVSDIHRGGVFAQIVGTLACLSNKEQHMIKGFIINRFRGDISLFEDGVGWIEKKTGKNVFGVMPWYDHFNIEAEDSVIIENPVSLPTLKKDTPAIAVIRLPHISNFTDFDPLSSLKGLDLFFIEKPQDLSNFKAVVLPGSKNTRWDLRWLKKTGWGDIIKKYTDSDGHALGICGGYQMMGRYVHDPHGLEGIPGTSEGLDLLPLETVLKAPKTTTRTRFLWENIEGTGYEIHMGETRRSSGDGLFDIIERNMVPCKTEEGCKTNNSKILGTYIHGMFDTSAITQKWLATIGISHIDVPDTNHLEVKDKAYDLLAAHFEKHMNTDAIFDLI
ncbi:MAG: cobyric acid synthase [Desulfobacteraceae bacterium]|nr:cobyric acid synthase [Desulfobacteraceae bacterium]MDH3875015.1 cobyric acid synthase [Desulfobacteraceae bacterium]